MLELWIGGKMMEQYDRISIEILQVVLIEYSVKRYLQVQTITICFV